jgi:hypothetical protein
MRNADRWRFSPLKAYQVYAEAEKTSSKAVCHIYRNQTSIKAEVMDNTLSVSPAFFDLYPALKVDFALEEIFHINTRS